MLALLGVTLELITILPGMSGRQSTLESGVMRQRLARYCDVMVANAARSMAMIMKG